MSRHRLLLLGVLTVLTACTTTPNPPSTVVPTSIDSFGANPNPSPVNVAVSFSWSVTGSNLTCTLDVDNNNTIDYAVQDCSSSNRVIHLYPVENTYIARLTVTGGDSQSRTSTLPVTIIPPNRPPLISTFVESAVDKDPLAVNFTWLATDPDQHQPFCQFDAESDGVWDYQGLCNEPGQNKRSFTHKFAHQGQYTSTLEASDPYSQTRQLRKVRVPFNRAPLINSLNATWRTDTAGTIGFSVSDPDNDSLTCKLTVQSIGTFRYNDCRQLTRNFTFPEPGTYRVTLEVDDGLEKTSRVTMLDEGYDPWKLPGYTSLRAHYFVCYTNASSKLFCWGQNSKKVISDSGTPTYPAPVPRDLSGIPGGVVTDLALTSGAACGLTPGGKAYCWGSDYNGELGNSAYGDSFTPVAVDMSGVEGGVFKKLGGENSDGSGATMCALTPAGKAYCWGYDNYTGNDIDTPVAIDMSEVAGGQFASLAVAAQHECGLTPQGKAYCWGNDYPWGLLGNDPDYSYGSSSKAAPTAVDMSMVAGGTFSSIAAGEDQTCGLTPAGPVYCWGRNTWGQLGYGSNSPAVHPIPVAVDMSGVPGGAFRYITSGARHVCGLTSVGKAYCWGSNDSGQLGLGDLTNRYVPTAVNMSGIEGGMFVRLEASGYITCGLTPAPALKLYCWGYDTYGSGAVGNGLPLVDENLPVPVDMSAIELP